MSIPADKLEELKLKIDTAFIIFNKYKNVWFGTSNKTTVNGLITACRNLTHFSLARIHLKEQNYKQFVIEMTNALTDAENNDSKVGNIAMSIKCNKKYPEIANETQLIQDRHDITTNLMDFIHIILAELIALNPEQGTDLYDAMMYIYLNGDKARDVCG